MPTNAAQAEAQPNPPNARRDALWRVISALCRFGLAAVWLVSGWLKITNPMETVQSVRAYELLSPDMAQLVGTALPPVELALGVLLLGGIFLRAAAGASAALLLVFIAGIISAWARGLSIDCGCFGSGGANPDVTGWTYMSEILRDLLFIAMAAWTVKWPFRRFARYP